MADWKRLAEHVIARRVHLGLPTRQALADASPLKLRTLGDIENARRDSYSPATLAAVEQALQWATGSIDAILSGGQATPVDGQQDASMLTGAGDGALVRVMRSDLTDADKAKIVRILIAEQERFAREHEARAKELIQVFSVTDR